MSELAKSDDYRHWIVSIKSRVQASQIKAAVSVNRELMELYWFLGEQIIEKQVAAQWGDGFLKQMGKDLQAEFPEIRGFSIRNLQRMRRWVEFWSEDAQQGNKAIGKQGDSGSGTTSENWRRGLLSTSPNSYLKSGQDSRSLAVSTRSKSMVTTTASICCSTTCDCTATSWSN